MVCGGGVLISKAWEEVTALAERLDMPVATSISGKGSIPEDHPLSLGVVGGNGAREYAHDFLMEADLVFYVGCRADSTTTIFWSLPPLDTDKTILQLDVDPREVGNSYALTHGLVGDAKLGLLDLLSAVESSGERRKRGSAERIAERSRAWWAETERQTKSDAYPMKPQRVVSELAQALPHNSVVVSDAGSMTPCAAALLTVPGGRHMVIPRSFGALGYALPGVVGAQMARPKSRIVALVGDGSFNMSVGELETIARLKLPVTIVHFRNCCFGWIKALQKLYLNGRYFAVDFGNSVDHVAVAEAFGLRGVRVEAAADVQSAIQEALKDSRATFIDVATEPENEEVPPVHQWLVKAGLCTPLADRAKRADLTGM
jgi:acetolactate synthase-1/2/3 large subunit